MAREFSNFNKGVFLKPRFLLSALPLLASLFILGCGKGVQPTINVPAEYQKGQAAFHSVCAGCHGPDADGSLKRAPNLIQKRYFKEDFNDRKIRNTILNGSQSGAMPSQKGRVKEKETIKEITRYLRFLQNQKASAKINGAIGS